MQLNLLRMKLTLWNRPNLSMLPRHVLNGPPLKNKLPPKASNIKRVPWPIGLSICNYRVFTLFLAVAFYFINSENLF